MLKRSIAAAAGGLAMLTAVGALPADAQEARGPIVPFAAPVSPDAPPMPSSDAWVLSGDFAGDDRDELFYYRTGGSTDQMVSFDNGGTAGGPLTWQVHNHSVSGNFFPVVGDFGGDSHDDIFWYGFGPDRDYLWTFTGFGSRTSTEVGPVTGTYWPVAGQFTQDDRDDILWYGVGSAPDFLWDFSSGNAPRSTQLTIQGDYEPVVGSFGTDGTDDVLWYGLGSDPDYLWDFVEQPDLGAQPSSRSMPVNGFYQPISLDAWNDGAQGDDIWWVTPGLDFIWDFRGGVLRRQPDFYDPDLPGTPTAGDFVGDGHEDILWTASGSAVLWDHTPNPTQPSQLDRWDYRFPTS